jgi:hypothetical protein
MIIYSKEIKTTRRGVEDTIKENSEECMLMGLQWENSRNRSKKLGREEGGWEKKIQRQCGKCRGEDFDGMD